MKLSEKNTLIEVATLANTNDLEQTLADMSRVLDALADTKWFGLGIDPVDYEPEWFCIGADPFGIEVLGTEFNLLPEWCFPAACEMDENQEKAINKRIKASKKEQK